MAKRKYTPQVVANYICQYIEAQKLADSLTSLKANSYPTPCVMDGVRIHAQMLRSQLKYIKKEVPSEVRNLVYTTPSLSALESLATNTLVEIGDEKSSDGEK